MHTIYSKILFIFLIFSYGSLIGSFLNVLILRIPAGQNWIWLSSHCPTCKKKLSWWMNIPIISYLLLSAKCYYCKVIISKQYPIIELFSAIKSVGIFLWINSWSLNAVNQENIIWFLYYDLMVSFLFTHFVIDFRHQILPDSINFILLLLVLLKTYFVGNWTDALMGASIGFLGTLAITYSFYLIRGKIGLGGGDIKLFGIIGLALGVFGIIQNLVLSSLLGVLVALVLIFLKKMDKNHPFAFGPSIIIIFLIQLLNPELLDKVLPRLN